MKPIGKAQGRGIFLFHKLSQIAQWKSDYRWKPDNPSVESYVVQRYISNPYLIGGKKVRDVAGRAYWPDSCTTQHRYA